MVKGKTHLFTVKKKENNTKKIKMQILCLPATSSEKQEPRWIEFIDMQITLKVPRALTAAVSVPDLHAVLLLRDGVDPIVRLAAIPVVVVVGGAICPLKVTLLA